MMSQSHSMPLKSPRFPFGTTAGHPGGLSMAAMAADSATASRGGR